MPSTQDFAPRLQALLRERKVSGRRLARELGVSENTVSAWTRGRHLPNANRLQAIADELGVGVEALLPNAKSSPAALSSNADPTPPAREDIERALETLAAATPDLLRLLETADRRGAR